MRIILLLLFVGFCLVSAKYLPSDDRDSNVMSRIKRADDSDESSSSIEQDKKVSESNANGDDDNDDDDDDDNDDHDILEKQLKEQEQADKIKRKALERQEKEKRKQEEQQRKIEEKRIKEQHKEQEKREKEERKRLEKLEKEKRKEEEKRLKEEKKKQEKDRKQLEQLEKELDNFEKDDFLETDEESSVELADVWKNHIYTKYGLTLFSTRIEKQAALNRYLQEELGLSPNSTESERRQAIVQLIQTKLQEGAAEQTALKNLLISHINAVSIQKLREKLEKDIEELNNKTKILNNVSLPWVPVARQNVEDRRSFLETIAQFLSNILPNWVIGGQTEQNLNSTSNITLNGPTDAITENNVNINLENSVSQSDNINGAPTGVNAQSPIPEKDFMPNSVITSSSDATSNSVSDTIINSSVVGSEDNGVTGENEGIESAGTVSANNNLVPSEVNNQGSVNDGNTVVTSDITDSPIADGNIILTESGVINNISSTNVGTDSATGIHSKPDDTILNVADVAHSSPESPVKTPSSEGIEGTLNMSSNVVSTDPTDDALTIKPESAISNSIDVSSQNVITSESGNSNIASGSENNPTTSVVNNVESSNIVPTVANVDVPKDSVINADGGEMISVDSTNIPYGNNNGPFDTLSPDSSNTVVPTTPNVVSFEGNQVVIENSAGGASTGINTNAPDTSLDTSSVGGSDGVSSSVNEAESSSATETSLGASIADNSAGSNGDFISANTAVTNKTFVEGELTTNGNEIANSDTVTSSTGSNSNYNGVTSPPGNTVSVNDANVSAGSTGNVLPVGTNGITIETSIGSTESNVINVENHNATTINSADVTSAAELVVPEGNPNMNETSIQPIDTSSSVKHVDTTIAPEINSVTADGESSAQTLFISTENPVDPGKVNEVFTTVSNISTESPVDSGKVNEVFTTVSNISTESPVESGKVNEVSTTVSNILTESPVDSGKVNEVSTTVSNISTESPVDSGKVNEVSTTVSNISSESPVDSGKVNEVSTTVSNISTESPVDSGKVNEGSTTVSNVISNVNTVSAPVETFAPSEGPLIQTSPNSIDETVPPVELTTLSDGITVPDEVGASVVEIVQQ